MPFNQPPAAVLLALPLCFALTACGDDQSTGKSKMKIAITCSAFNEGQPIPEQYTGDGKDMSPPLQWSGVPSSAKSLALIADDPDAPMGTWVHWVLYDLSSDTTALPENLDRSQYLSNHAKQGMNDFHKLGYGGPQPPPGKPHRYFFKLYALDVALDLKPGLTKKDLLAAIEGHIIAEGQLMGTYQHK